MRKAFELIRMLADGHVRSGEALAASLGISRAAVWNRIRNLRACGMEVHAVTGRGYRLPGGYDFLDAGHIEAALASRARGSLRSIEVLPVVDSTNQRLLDAAARAEVIHGRVVAAEYQTAGRGRRGDRWYAPPGSGVCLSLGWRFDAPPSSLSALSLVAGVATARMACRLGAAGVELKWPNDLMFAGRKLAGILIEMRSEFGGPCVVVIGIGVNLALPTDAQGRIDQPCSDLRAACGRVPSRNTAVAYLIEDLVDVLGEFAAYGFAPFAAEWRGLDALAGRNVRLVLPDRVVVGVGRGVEEHGALIVEHHGGHSETFITGHVSVENGTACC